MLFCGWVGFNDSRALVLSFFFWKILTLDSAESLDWESWIYGFVFQTRMWFG